MRRWNELFALFFDPSVPLAFVVGSLALAIAGSALYSLLSTWFGSDPPGQAMLLLSSLVIVLLAVVLLRQSVHFWMRRQKSGQLVIPEGEQVEPHKSLILPIGLSNKGAEQTIIAYHAEHSTLNYCWMLVSAEVEKSSKFGDLRQFLLDSNVEVHSIRVDDIRDAAASYRATLDAIRAARAMRNAEPIIADITSGTSVMSVGIALAAREQHIPVQYYPATYQPDTGEVNPNSATAPALVAFVSAAVEVR